MVLLMLRLISSAYLSTINVYVVANIAELLILVSDFLSHNHVVIHYSSKIVSSCSDLVRAPIIRNGDGQQVARLIKFLDIFPGSERIVNIKCDPRFLKLGCACGSHAIFSVLAVCCCAINLSNR
jgi:hypothetical protein